MDDSVLFCPTEAAVLGRQRDAALIFCFVLHQGKMNWSEAELKIGVSQIGRAKYKPDGALDKIER
ncbi:MAG: hypothetical protein LBT43_06945 [Prevotella sp.]|jgi:hypothetical protein|nr:hypothetical protein [Prevotella sp.]